MGERQGNLVLSTEINVNWPPERVLKPTFGALALLQTECHTLLRRANALQLQNSLWWPIYTLSTQLIILNYPVEPMATGWRAFSRVWLRSRALALRAHWLLVLLLNVLLWRDKLFNEPLSKRALTVISRLSNTHLSGNGYAAGFCAY